MSKERRRALGLALRTPAYVLASSIDATLAGGFVVGADEGPVAIIGLLNKCYPHVERVTAYIHRAERQKDVFCVEISFFTKKGKTAWFTLKVGILEYDYASIYEVINPPHL